MAAYITIGASCIIFESVIVLHPSQFAKSLWNSTTDAFWRAVGSVFTKKTATEGHVASARRPGGFTKTRGPDEVNPATAKNHSGHCPAGRRAA